LVILVSFLDRVEDVGGLIEAEIAQVFAPGRPRIGAKRAGDDLDHVPILGGHNSSLKKKFKKMLFPLAW
jgi:hypothetical protein